MTRIGPSIRITGELVGSEDVLVEGCIRGQVHLRDATLTVARPGRVDAAIRASRVAVHGTVRGPVAATERIDMAASADVEGSLSANLITMAEGARFDGAVDMDRRTIASRVAQFKAEQAGQ